jgi:competence protein ComEC
MEIAVVSVSAESNYLQKARNRLAASVRSAVAEPQASLLLGSVFGRGLGFDRDFKEKMIRSGTIHLVAVSGFNIVVLAAVLQGAGYFISRRVIRALLINGIVWLFVIFSGAPLSALRAALMFTCGEISYLAGRGVRPATGIISAAALICIWDPSAIADAGFLLSFASILGLAIFSKPIEVLLGRVINKDFTTSIAPSLAAQLGVLPASIFIFGSVSAATIPANILASFIVEILFAAAVAASFFALIGLPIVAWLIGYPAASVMVRLIEIFSNFPQFGVVGRLPLVVFMILWLGIVGYLISKKHEEAY